ncbi:MAG: serine O-acetyltransferase [Acidobacteriota bacterium]|jgi:serine O-acetyltransferase|nr:serine O-acetyltransferase [Acidobacteriota bacterium]MDT5262312.1 serine O-acetyltransferase [Acidobacteriota bacterium]
MNEKISRAAEALVESYSCEGVKIHHLDRRPLPSRAEAVAVLDALQELLFPGYTGAQGLTGASLRLHVESRVAWLYETLTEQISRAINHGERLDDACPVTDRQATECAEEFLARLPRVREVLATDVRAAYEGDPSAACYDEIIFSYPGLYAIMTYRLAHELHTLDVPLIPRIMTEHAHSRTGIDIHPGTRVGSSFFIDHGTGVVVGGTAVIGANVKLYQGVTLGAFSFDKDGAGQLIRHTKRHPTIEDDVVVYAGATILGGDTVIGRGSVIGGNVWLTHSVPPDTRVLQDSPRLRIITAEEATAS